MQLFLRSEHQPLYFTTDTLVLGDESCQGNERAEKEKTFVWRSGMVGGKAGPTRSLHPWPLVGDRA